MKYGNRIRRMVAPLLILSFLVGCDGGDWEGTQEGPWVLNEQVESWHGRIRNLIIDGTRFLPVKVGAVAAIMVDLLWPKSRRDIWKLIQEDVERTIDREITKNILRERQAELEALQRNIKSYSETERLTEKGNYLTVCLAGAVSLFYKITNDKEHDAQLAPIAVTLAAIHISLLRERYEYGDKLYPRAMNRDPMWLKELLEFYDDYIRYFYGHDRDGTRVQESLMDRWAKYRRSLFEEKHWRSAGIVKDSFGQLIDRYYSDQPYVKFIARNNSIKEYWKPEIDQARNMVMTRETLLFADEIMGCVTILCRMLPEDSHPDAGERSYRVHPDLRTITVGPVAYHTLQGEKRKSVTVSNPEWVLHNEDQEGTLYRIFVREYNAIDGLQLEYSDGFQGPFIGNPNGGVLHSDIIRPEGDCFNGFGFGFTTRDNTRGGLHTIRFFSSRHETEWMGNRAGWGLGAHTTLRAINYEVPGAAFKYSTGSEPKGNITCIYVRFVYRNPPSEE